MTFYYTANTGSIMSSGVQLYNQPCTISFAAKTPITISFSGKSSSYSNCDSFSYSGSSDLKPGLFQGALAGKEGLVSSLAHKYGISPALAASVIGLESGWGTSNLAYHNNFGGCRCEGDAGVSEHGFGYFSTLEKGLEKTISNLASYADKYDDVQAVDFANLDAIAVHYCNSSWADQIRNVYNTKVQRYLA